MFSCLLMKLLMVNKCCKFRSHICHGFEREWIGTKNLTKLLSRKKGHFSCKNLNRVMYSCLLMEVMMLNKCCKFRSHIYNGFEKKWIGTKNLTKILRQKRAIILRKILTELCTLVCWWWWVSVVSFKSIFVMVLTKKWIGTKTLTKVWHQRRRQRRGD